METHLKESSATVLGWGVQGEDKGPAISSR